MLLSDRDFDLDQEADSPSGADTVRDGAYPCLPFSLSHALSELLLGDHNDRATVTKEVSLYSRSPAVLMRCLPTMTGEGSENTLRKEGKEREEDGP